LWVSVALNDGHAPTTLAPRWKTLPDEQVTDSAQGYPQAAH
jgi:hypothetical protein